jgi:hypothetical protein
MFCLLSCEVKGDLKMYNITITYTVYELSDGIQYISHNWWVVPILLFVIYGIVRFIMIFIPLASKG